MDDKSKDAMPENGTDETQGMQSFSEPEVVRPDTDPSAPPAVLQPTQPTPPQQQEPVLMPSSMPDALPSPTSGAFSAPTATPMSAQMPISSMPASPVPLGVAGKKSKFLLPIVLALVLVLGGGAAAYVTVFQKTPEKLWSRALSNTVEGLDTMLQTSLSQEDKGTKMEGSIKVESPAVIEATMGADFYETNGTFSASVSASGARMNAEIRSITQDGAKTPDVYVKVDGIDQLGALLGSSTFLDTDSLATALNDQWFFLDHTLIEQYLTSTGAEEASMEISKEDVDKIADKVMVVMRDRFFASDDKGVFTLSEKVGKEKFEDTNSYKVKVAVNKENFKQFVTELKDAIKDTKLEEALKASDPEKSLEEVLNFDKMLEELEKADFSKATADVWIEANGGYIRNVRIYPVENDTNNYLDFGLNYTGGDVYPLGIKATIDDEGDKGTLAFGMEVNSKSADVTMNLNADITSNGSPFKIAMEMSLVGTNENVEVEEPAGATNVLELLGSLQDSSMSESLDSSSLEQYDMFDDTLLDDEEL